MLLETFHNKLCFLFYRNNKILCHTDVFAQLLVAIVTRKEYKLTRLKKLTTSYVQTGEKNFPCFFFFFNIITKDTLICTIC